MLGRELSVSGPRQGKGRSWEGLAAGRGDESKTENEKGLLE